MLVGSFYQKYVKLLPVDEIPFGIRDNPKFFPYFEFCRGSIDGSHFDSWVASEATVRSRNRKGFVSQNVLAVCDWLLRFLYMLPGWEGSAADSRVFEYARRHDLRLPRGYYFLADAGFPLCSMLMTPYRGVRYHLKEWAQGSQKYVFNAGSFQLLHDLFSGLRIIKSFSTFATHQHETQLSVYLVFSSVNLAFFKPHRSIQWTCKQCSFLLVVLFTILSQYTTEISSVHARLKHKTGQAQPQVNLLKDQIKQQLNLVPSQQRSLEFQSQQRKERGPRNNVIKLQSQCGETIKPSYKDGLNKT
jgi:hypothetical protein